MISYFAVKEQSMEPSFKEGDFVMVDRMSYLFSRPKVGHVVIARHPQKPDMLLLKRIVEESRGMYFIKGDNSLASTDSRHFGWLKKDLVIGKVIHKTGSCALGIMS